MGVADALPLGADVVVVLEPGTGTTLEAEPPPPPLHAASSVAKLNTASQRTRRGVFHGDSEPAVIAVSCDVIST